MKSGMLWKELMKIHWVPGILLKENKSIQIFIYLNYNFEIMEVYISKVNLEIIHPSIYWTHTLKTDLTKIQNFPTWFFMFVCLFYSTYLCSYIALYGIYPTIKTKSCEWILKLGLQKHLKKHRSASLSIKRKFYVYWTHKTIFYSVPQTKTFNTDKSLVC